MKAAPRGLTTTICILDFITVVTSDAYSKRHPSTIVDCRKFLGDLTDKLGVRVLAPTAGFEKRLLDFASALGVRGRKLHDLAIAVIALDGGARELWTHDEHFVVPPRLQRKLPLAG